MPKLCKLVQCFFVAVKLSFEECNVILAFSVVAKCRLLRFRFHEIVIVMITQIFLLDILCIVGTSNVIASFVMLDAVFGSLLVVEMK